MLFTFCKSSCGYVGGICRSDSSQKFITPILISLAESVWTSSKTSGVLLFKFEQFFSGTDMQADLNNESHLLALFSSPTSFMLDDQTIHNFVTIPAVAVSKHY